MSEDNKSKHEIYKNAKVAFKKLEVKKGDIVVVELPDNIHPEQMQVFAEHLQEVIPPGTTVLCTRDGVKISTLPKKELNAAGWYNYGTSSVIIPDENKPDEETK